MSFNPNELVLEKIRAVEEYDVATNELLGRYTQIESPTLATTATGTNVVDSMGSSIMTFYNAQSGTFGFTNSLFSLDLAASQLASEKAVASASKKLTMPVSEIVDISADNKVVLKYAPVGTPGAEVKYVKVINSDNTFGETYEISATAGEGKFTLDVATKTLTLPSGVTGRVFVNYTKETTTAVKITKTTDGVPEVRSLLIHAIFHDPCNKNIVYSGAIWCPRAQIDPTNISINLTSEGKHAASYVLQKEYCAKESKLFEIMVSED
ncbi:hypothetical protein [Anaerocolumna xylanovorans]|uniref:Uncharacterized protein n=1 Tax=Anaerocolumna xylanovorans DSM 12503 TaxID=1121345 RepID=A0A1M7YM54_9FIRM|nr:hypothetical protein [Anaerocolumna xylanovorans]SHO53687.1 hypothetical protein SAMN02745217_04235 [Anaerocolumna xylanovorans DSM 12503]